MENNQMEQTAMRVSKATIIANTLLSVLKFMAGFIAGSSAMISDAIHSASDVFSTFIVMIGIKLSNKESDIEHPYGHERLECVAAIILSVLLCVTGIGIGYSGMAKILSGNYEDLSVPGLFALVVAVISIAAKEVMYWYTLKAAKRIDSGALKADAWHHRSDALSSIGSFIGILGARMGFPVLDPIASVIICLFIFKVSIDIFKDAVNKMTDTAADEMTSHEIEDIVLSQTGVQGIDQLRTRLFGNRIYVDIEITVNGSLTLSESHEIAQSVHDSVEKKLLCVKHCMVHVNPIE